MNLLIFVLTVCQVNAMPHQTPLLSPFGKTTLSLSCYHSLWKEHGLKWPFTSATTWATVLIIITFCAFVDMAAVTMIRVRVSTWAFDKFRSFYTKKDILGHPELATLVPSHVHLNFRLSKQNNNSEAKPFICVCVCLIYLFVIENIRNIWTEDCFWR